MHISSDLQFGNLVIDFASENGKSTTVTTVIASVGVFPCRVSHMLFENSNSQQPNQICQAV